MENDASDGEYSFDELFKKLHSIRILGEGHLSVSKALFCLCKEIFLLQENKDKNKRKNTCK